MRFYYLPVSGGVEEEIKSTEKKTVLQKCFSQKTVRIIQNCDRIIA